jgi:PKHD-type hydroxylase
MMIVIPDIFSPEELALGREILEKAAWVDGGVTAGHQSGLVKNNLQLPQESEASRKVGEMILRGLVRSPLFMSAALPKEIFPPLFNRYASGQSFGSHVDNAVRHLPGGRGAIRTDLSCTFFFARPDEYEGGELCVRDTYGVQKVKLPAGQMILYPSSSLHWVNPVTRGARLCSFFWLQSLIRQDERRSLLFDMDLAIQRLAGENPRHLSVLELTNNYHNLLRMWAEL